MSSTYNRMDVVLVKADFTDDWRLGIVDKDFVPDDIWVRATVKEGPSSTSMRCPGYDPQEVRLATEADIAAAPDYARTWLQREREREELRLLNLRDPMVRAKTRKGAAALRAAGINRLSDLGRFTDTELLALDGIGRTAVQQWREQAVAKEAAANG